MVEPGPSATIETTVSPDLTARAVGSGDVAVLATPMVLALVERAAVAALGRSLEPGTTTVGVRAELDHVAPTPVGGRVRVTARLDEVEGRRLRFSFAAEDGGGLVARGAHVRVVVERARFEEGARRRLPEDR